MSNSLLDCKSSRSHLHEIAKQEHDALQMSVHQWEPDPKLCLNILTTFELWHMLCVSTGYFVLEIRESLRTVIALAVTSQRWPKEDWSLVATGKCWGNSPGQTSAQKIHR